VSSPVVLALMSFCFLFFGYSACPCRFSLMAGVFVGASLTDVSLAAIVQKIFDGMMDPKRCWRSVLSVGRRAHEFGQRRGADRQPVAVAGRHIRVAVAGRRRLQHVLSEMSGSTTAGRRRDEPRARRPDEARRLQSRFIAAIIASASPSQPWSTEHHGRGLWRGRQRFDRRPVHGGVVPGFMIGFGLMIYCYFFAPPACASRARPFPPGHIRKPATPRCR